MIRTVSLLAVLGLSACETGPLGGEARFGAATEANIANQSVNPQAANPNTNLRGGEGGRAGQAVERLREGEAEAPSTEGIG